MLVTIQANVVCTIEDGFHLMNLAREAVDAAKAPEDRDLFYPDSPTRALEILIRQAIAQRLLTCGGATLHEIGHHVASLDMPFEP